jgi:tellurite methyltransferase
MTQNSWEIYWNNLSTHDYWEKPAPEVLDFIRSLSALKSPAVLDLGCGLGRHAIAFALAGFTVTATDSSQTAVRHLKKWAEGEHLSVETRADDMLDNALLGRVFDIVLSYNVIYHGSRERFARAIQYVYKLLKPKGLFFFTCPSRQDGKYGFGEMVAPHTYSCEKSVTPGDIHYFSDEQDLDELLEGFQLIKRWKSEGYWNNRGGRQFYSNWHVLAEKC